MHLCMVWIRRDNGRFRLSMVMYMVKRYAAKRMEQSQQQGPQIQLVRGQHNIVGVVPPGIKKMVVKNVICHPRRGCSPATTVLRLFVRGTVRSTA